MLERFRFAWQAFKAELWDGSDATASLYACARHAAEARIAADPTPRPDPLLMARIISGQSFYRPRGK